MKPIKPTIPKQPYYNGSPEHSGPKPKAPQTPPPRPKGY